MSNQQSICPWLLLDVTPDDRMTDTVYLADHSEINEQSAIVAMCVYGDGLSGIVSDGYIQYRVTDGNNAELMASARPPCSPVIVMPPDASPALSFATMKHCLPGTHIVFNEYFDFPKRTASFFRCKKLKFTWRFPRLIEYKERVWSGPIVLSESQSRT